MQSNTPRTEYTILQDIEALCKSKGYAHALAFLSAEASFINAEDLVDSKKMNEIHWESILRSEVELLIGFMAKAKIEIFLDTISQDKIQDYVEKSKELLTELRKLMGAEIGEAFETSNKEESKKILMEKGFKEGFFYSAETACDFQYNDLANKKHKNDAKWLTDNKGFSAEHLYKFGVAIDEIIRSKIGALMSYNPENSDDLFTFLPCFYVLRETIIEQTKLSEDIINKILDMFSVNSFPCNEKFKTHGSDNEMSYRPIIKVDDIGLLLLQPRSLYKSFYESPFYWMLDADEKDKDKADKNRGKFAEKFCTDRLRDVFGDANVYENVEIFKKGGNKSKNDKGEIDVLVIYAGKAIIVQVKTKKMTLETMKGNVDKTKDDFEKGIKHPYDQSYSCAKLLLNSKSILTDKNSNKLEIQRDFQDIFLMCIVADTYPVLAVQTSLLLEPKEHPIIHKPCITDIFVLDTICEFLDNPIYFLDYQQKRAKYFNNIRPNNELNIFGRYLTDNLLPGEIDDSPFHIPDIYSTVIEPSFLARRGYHDFANKTPEGMLTKFKGTYFEKIISELEYHIKKEGAIDFAYFLLNLHKEETNIYSKVCESMIKEINKIGKALNFTLDSPTDKMGATFFVHPDDIEKAIENANFYCHMFKYNKKAKTWFAVLLNHLPDGKPFIRDLILI